MKHELIVDFKTEIYGPTKENPAPVLTYPRLVELYHNGAANGTILATAESLDEESYIIHVSRDGGKSFEILSRITEPEDSGLVCNWQPFIYELPCAVGGLPEGTMLFSGCIRDRAVKERSQIVLWASRDLGKSFEKLSVVAEAGGIDHGVWEPFLYAEDGVLYCFYSDDNDPVCSQTIVLKTSTDGLEWSKMIQATACADRRLRPGMAAVAKMGNGEYILTYEMVGMHGNPVHYKKTRSLTDWGDVSENGKLLVTDDGVSVGSAPYCAWTPDGGEKGCVIVTAHNMASGSSETGTEIMLSFDFGESWTHAENPLPYTMPEKYKGLRCAYSPCFFVRRDNSLFYVNDINCDEPFENKSRIVLAHLTVK